MKKLLLSSLLIANGVAAAPFVVKDIRVDGVSADTQAAIISSLPVKVGQRATDSDITNVVRQLFVQKQFKNVSANREGNTLVINVVERPVIANVELEGNEVIPKDAIEENLKANLISQGEMYDAEKLEAFRQGLLDHYKSVGRYNATVETVVTPQENGQVNVKLVFNENDVAYVKSINFEGNNAFDADTLMEQLDIQPDVSWWNIFESSKFEQEAYKKDLENLRQFYLNHGYVKFAIQDVDTQFSEDNKEVNLTYKLSEGDQYKVSDVQIIGNTANLDPELEKIIKEFETGDLFRSKDILAIQEALKSKLGANGYGSAKVDLRPVFNEENKTVSARFVVDAGKRMYVRQIRFEGNDVTADSTLRREMRQQEGAWLSTTALATGKSRLERTGFYESVEMETVPVQGTNDQLDVVYKIKERNTGSINAGIGYGTGSGISYQLGIKQDNFLGMGSTVSLNGVKNDYSTTIRLGYNEPYFTKDGVSLGGSIYYTDYDYSEISSSSDYKRTTLGGDITLGFPVDEYNSYYLGLGIVHDKIKNVQREYTREKYVEAMDIEIPEDSTHYKNITTTDFNFSYGWNYNSLNRGYFPTEGLKANIGGQVTIPGSDNEYYKLGASFSHFYPLNREHSWVLNTRMRLGYENGLGGKKVPFFATYSAGGMGSVRGFSSGAIGPKALYWDADAGDFTDLDNGDVIGGNALAVANLELIVPTPFVSAKNQHMVRTSLFVDAGTVWNTKWKSNSRFSSLAGYEDYGKFSNFRASAGIGFEWSSPIGPLRFSYAKPIKDYEGDDIENFQFSIGGSF